MLCLQECLDMSDLSQEAIDAIAEHEHVPEIIAAELGSTLLQSHRGLCLIRQYLDDDIRQAAACGDTDKLVHLRQASRDFAREHAL